MDKQDASRLFGNMKIPGVIAVVGSFLALIGYLVGNEVMIAGGWVFIIFGCGWLWILLVQLQRAPSLGECAPELQKENTKTVPCATCGKSIPVNRAVEQDDKLICQDCYNKQRISKRASKK